MSRRPITASGVFRVGPIVLALASLAVASVCGSDEDRTLANTASHTSPAFTNRLAQETSPYLLQHAHNPVDWYPWGQEAFDKAQRENKVIFLSIGYSACHWCHVMERESFEDPAVAAILNEHFVSIKVDREERPDVDDIYMTAVQMMTGQGGWPLNVFLTPGRKPFYGGTYFPPEERFGRPSFTDVLNRVSEVWEQQGDEIVQSADELVAALKQNVSVASSDNSAVPPMATIDQAVTELGREFDSKWGGFRGAPKFPPTGAISVLLRRHDRTGDAQALKMATLTLDRMAFGGMYDQIGGGFHRYSTDAEWLVPHFEKMLYDNALLAKAYIEAWQLTRKDLYRRTAEGIFAYVLRDMTDPRGAFHSSEDADSEGVEGKFYVWSIDEIQDVLGDDDAAFFSQHYGVSEEGNFEDRNILNVSHANAAAAEDATTEARLVPLRAKLMARRAERIRPGKDDKVLAAWNGMMISAFARGYQAFGDVRYLQAAEAAADFVLSEMVRDGVLLRTYRGVGGKDGTGESKLPGYLSDYAQMTSALIDLYESTFDPARLDSAERLAEKMIGEFWDEENGGFFSTSERHKNLLVTTKPFQDGATPSGNAVAALALLRLAKLLDPADFGQRAERTLASASEMINQMPRGFLNSLVAAGFHHGPTREIALAGTRDSTETKALLGAVRERFLPNVVVALIDPSGETSQREATRVPWLDAKVMLSDRSTAYVCESFVCKRPVTDVAALEKVLDATP